MAKAHGSQGVLGVAAAAAGSRARLQGTPWYSQLRPCISIRAPARAQQLAVLMLQLCVCCSLLLHQICTHSDFELIVMLLIFGNCISLALYNPMEPEDSLHNGTLTKLGAHRVPVGCSSREHPAAEAAAP